MLIFLAEYISADKEELSLLQILESQVRAYLADKILTKCYATAKIIQMHHPVEKNRYMVYIIY